MSVRDGYYSDLVLICVLRSVLALGLIGFGLLVLGGCSPRNTTFSQEKVAVERSELPALDLQALTRNDQPQGGDHEKSDCTPRKPAG
jgi:hypothetical protein